MAKPLREKRDKTQDEYEFEKGKEECTFQPNIEETQKFMGNIYYTRGESDYFQEIDT